MEKYIKIPKDTSSYSIIDEWKTIKIRFNIDLSIEEYNEFRKTSLDTKIEDINSLTIEFNNLFIQIIDPIALRVSRRNPRGGGNIDMTISIDYERENPNYNLTVGKTLMRDRILEELLK